MDSDEGEGEDRVFDPTERMYEGLSMSDMLVYNDAKVVWRQLQHTLFTRPGSFKTEENSMVIAIDGACRGNGTTKATAAYGLYFGPESPRNSRGCLPSTSPQTNQAAEIAAAVEALNEAQTVTDHDPTISHIVLITDSAYLVDSITRHIYSWVANGFKNSRSREVANRSAFEKLHSMIQAMENDGITVQFWLVPREFNTDADQLANLAFDAAGGSAPEGAAVLPTPKVKVSPAWDHWNFIAPTLPAAQILARRLKLEFPKREAFNNRSQLRYPLRRLVTTGEDIPENFHLLLGPGWEPAIEEEWQKYRIWILENHTEVASRDRDGWLSWADYEAPFVTPRPASEQERAEL